MPLYTRYKLPSYRKSCPLFVIFALHSAFFMTVLDHLLLCNLWSIGVYMLPETKEQFSIFIKKKSLRKRTLCICKLTHMRTIKKAPKNKFWDLCILFPQLFSDCSLVYWEGCDLWRWKVKWETPTTRDNSMRQSLTTRRLENLDDSLIHFRFFLVNIKWFFSPF